MPLHARQGRPFARPAQALARARDTGKLDGIQKVVYALWFVILFEPQWWAAEHGLSPLLKVPLALMVVLLLLLVTKPTKGDWILPLLGWVAATAANFPFAYDRGLSVDVFKSLIVYYVFGLGLVRAIRTPKTAGPILFMLCVGQFIWWGAVGIKSGLVAWHPNLANPDGYGPLMAIGVGPAYFYATATKNKLHRNLAFLAAALSVIGVVSAFARGAVAGLVATIGYIWLRSPNKGRTTIMMAAAAVVMLGAGSMIDGNTRDPGAKSDFVAEMLSMFDKGDGTANDRKAMWAAATREFLEHPVMGVGAQQFGVYAAANYAAGSVGGDYAENPGTLYGRALHSNYYQILSEYGLIGVFIFTLLCVQFFKGTRLLNRPESQRIWEAQGGTTEVGKIALGLEAGMVAFLLTGYFYNQIFVPWFYSLIFAVIALRQIVQNPQFAAAARTLPQRARAFRPAARV